MVYLARVLLTYEVAEVGNHVVEKCLDGCDYRTNFRFCAVAEHFQAAFLAMDSYFPAHVEGLAVDLCGPSLSRMMFTFSALNVSMMRFLSICPLRRPSPTMAWSIGDPLRITITSSRPSLSDARGAMYALLPYCEVLHTAIWNASSV